MPDSQSLFMFAAIAFLVVMMVLNSRKRKKQQTEMESALKPGAWVMSTTGIYGQLESINEDKVVLETTPGVKLLIAKGAIARIVDAPVVAASAVVKPAAKPAVKAAAAKKPAAKPASTTAAKTTAKKPAAKKPATASTKK